MTEIKKEIEEVIELYFQGARDGRIEYLKEAFHKDCMIYFINKDQNLMFYNQNEFHKIVLENYKYAVRRNRLLSLDFCKNIASAKVRADYPEFYFIDYLNLMNISGKWKIINKVTVRSSVGFHNNTTN